MLYLVDTLFKSFLTGQLACVPPHRQYSRFSLMHLHGILLTSTSFPLNQ